MGRSKLLVLTSKISKSMKYSFLITFVFFTIAGCGGEGEAEGFITNDSELPKYVGNAKDREEESLDVNNEVEDAVSSSDTVALPIRKGRWDPPPIRHKPLRGSARSRQLKYMKIVNTEANRAGLDPRFAHAIISRESLYNTMAMSTICKGKPKRCYKDHRTAHGLMQLMPATSKAMGLPASMRRSHPQLNVRAGIRYLSRMKWAKGNLQAMAAGYNSGPARAKALLQGNRQSRYWKSAQPSTSNGVPGKSFWGGETYHYAQHVAGYYELYSANPQLIGLVPKKRSSSCMERGQC